MPVFNFALVKTCLCGSNRKNLAEGGPMPNVTGCCVHSMASFTEFKVHTQAAHSDTHTRTVTKPGD